MSYNDRLEEAAIWVSAQPGDTIPMPKAELAAALWEARENPGHWPYELEDWARDPDHRATAWSQVCWDASIPADWDSYLGEIGWDDSMPEARPTHAQCTHTADDCRCPCHRGGEKS